MSRLSKKRGVVKGLAFLFSGYTALNRGFS